MGHPMLYVFLLTGQGSLLLDAASTEVSVIMITRYDQTQWYFLHHEKNTKVLNFFSSNCWTTRYFFCNIPFFRLNSLAIFYRALVTMKKIPRVNLKGGTLLKLHMEVILWTTVWVISWN